MELVIPDGAQVHITVGHPPLLALPHDRSADAPPPGRSTGRLAKGLVAGVLFIGAFQAGRFLPHHAQTASAAPPAALAGSGAADGNAAGGNAAGEIPPAFRAQMAQPPQVVPPPGAAAPASDMGGSTGSPTAAPAPPAANPFGLHS